MVQNGMLPLVRQAIRGPIMTLTGDVVNRIAIEVPTNTTIREVIYEFGGGIRGARNSSGTDRWNFRWLYTRIIAGYTH